MTVRHLDFGFYPRPLNISAGAITISTFANFNEIVSQVMESEGVENGWIFAPPQEAYDFDGNTSIKPYPSRVFGLPKTHKLSHASSDGEDHLAFHIWTLSFFTGMRLSPSEAGFLDSATIQTGKLVDFSVTKKGLENAVLLSEAFWLNHRSVPAKIKLVVATINALLMSTNHCSLQFEKFLLLYSALDSCFALAKSIHGAPSEKPSHSDRVIWMCNLFQMPVPEWAQRCNTKITEVATIRNQAVHEALFMGEPLGFALHGVGTSTNIISEMQALICRLLAALLEVNDLNYQRSPVSTQQTHFMEPSSPA